MHKNLSISEEVRTKAPQLKIIQIEADVKNGLTSDALWAEIEAEENRVGEGYAMPEVNKRPAIAATRAAYKAMGKEPNRYRPSAEALCRRCVKKMGIYRLTTLVDLINLVSMRSGYSIGGFDLDRITGDDLVLGIGREGEPFEAIGRGMLNIHCLPVWRDAEGGIGTPTSDTERTKLTADTRRVLLIFNVYGEEMPVEDTIEFATDLLKRYAFAENIAVNII